MRSPIRLLIVDDHTVVRQGLRMLLSQRYNIEVVGEADNGASAVRLAAGLRPDVILMDLMMPEMDGRSAIAAIREQNPRARILVLTSLGSESHMAAAVRAGAMGFLGKESSPDELVRAIHDVHKGRLALPSTMLSLLLGDPRQEAEDPPLLLSARELDVLAELAHGAANEDIAAALNVSVNTVRSHVRHILEKLGLDNRTQAAIYAFQCGLVPLVTRPGAK